MIFISQMFYFRIIHEFLNSPARNSYLEIAVFNITENFEFTRQQIREY